MSNSEVLIVAGEVSGDLHAAPVVRELKELSPALKFFGSGGSLMRDAGVELLAGLDEIAVMGFSDVPKVLPRLSRLKKQFITRVRDSGVTLAILVDYPGFNLNLARALKKLPNPPKILFYIAPQVWAWRSGRVKLMSKVVDQLAVVFPFELDIFRKADVPVEFVGHPLIDELSEAGLPDGVRVEGKRDSSVGTLIALLPGSRRQEVQRNLPIMVAAAERMRAETDLIEFAVGCPTTLDRGIYSRYPGGREWLQLRDDSRELLAEADVAAVCSGTATLEAALLGTPQVVVYKTSGLNYLLARRVVTLSRIALVNVVAGKRVVEELLQSKFTGESLAGELKRLLTDPGSIETMKQDYLRIRNLLGEGGAAKRVAELATKLIGMR